MKLLETNWNAPGGAAEVEVEYPDQPIQDMMNWLRRTSAWKENPELVERKLRRLNMVLMTHREQAAPTERRQAVESVMERRLAGLAKARETVARNRAAKKAGSNGAAT